MDEASLVDIRRRRRGFCSAHIILPDWFPDNALSCGILVAKPVRALFHVDINRRAVLEVTGSNPSAPLSSGTFILSLIITVPPIHFA